MNLGTFKEYITEYTFITRAVNDSKDKLKELYPNYKIGYLNFKEYDITKEKVIKIPFKHYTILVILKGKNKLVYDVEGN